MKIFYAGYGFTKQPLVALFGLVRHRLISLEYVKDVELWLDLAKEKQKKHDLIIDSGAYSAWRRGTTLDMETLIEGVNIIREEAGEYLDEFNIINADIIPGVPNVPATREQVESSAELSYGNWQLLTGRGIPTLPVHHQGEDMHHLQKYLDNGCEYVCLSPANDRYKKSRRHYLNACFNLLHTNGFSDVKTHALGLTSQDLMDEFPFYSVDSATCPINASFGKIWCLMENNQLRLVSLTQRLLKHGGEMHYDLVPTTAQREVDKAVEACGVTVAQLRKDENFVGRALFNLCTFNKYEDILSGKEPGNYVVPQEVIDENGSESP